MTKRFIQALLCLQIFSLSLLANIDGKPAPDVDITVDNNLTLQLHGLNTDILTIDEEDQDYQRFKVLANDNELFTANLGAFWGTIFYNLCPTSFLMQSFITFVQKIPSWQWLILDKKIRL